jgi:hypothetical protein
MQLGPDSPVQRNIDLPCFVRKVCSVLDVNFNNVCPLTSFFLLPKGDRK